MIDKSIIASENASAESGLRSDFESLGEHLDRRGIDIERIVEKVSGYGVAIPSWGVGTGGTRFARFPGEGEPRDIFDKLEDCAVVHQLTGATPNVSLHIPWDKADPNALHAKAHELGLSFDAMNSNTFSDAAGQVHSYKFGSLTHADPASGRPSSTTSVHQIGRAIGSKALTVWIGMAPLPGQTNFTPSSALS